MKGDIVLEFMDGRREEATMSRPFLADENEIRVVRKDTGRNHTYLLTKISCVCMRPEDNPIKFHDIEHSKEEIILATDKLYICVVPKNQPYKNGFYGLSVDAASPHKLIFFTTHGVKARQETRLIGEILEEKGVITHFSVEQVLEEQRRLREQRLGEILSEKHDLSQSNIDKAIDTARKEGKASPRMKVGEILIEAGLVTHEQVEFALASQDLGKKKKIGTLLVEKGFITETHLLEALAVKFRLPFIDLDSVKPPSARALAALPADVVHKYQVLPLEEDEKRLVVATSEPTDYTIPDSLRFYTKRRIDLVVATSMQISAAILKHYPKAGYGIDDLLSDMSTDAPVIDQQPQEADISESDSQIVTLVGRILMDAYSKGASDIHFEPGRRGQALQVRYRIDGICRVVNQIPMSFKRAVISRIKIMANLDITERRKPQSGKIVLWSQNNQIEYRVEIVPTTGENEDAVLRILHSSEPLPLEQMGFSENNLKAFRRILSQPYGIILCVGPTGSGKTTTLHSALKYRNTPDVKIWTIEDPVEITQAGLRQVQVQYKIGLTFPEALRSFLRADPDIIMIGEMRDAETAKTAIEASLTGHLVLSTLHTNSAPETINRLIEMGMDTFNFADALLGVLAQRLARKLCDRCREPYHPSRQEYDRLVSIYGPDSFEKHHGHAYSDTLTLMKKKGCPSCDGSGYKGRVAIHELLVSSDGIKHLIRRNAPNDELKEQALREGMRTLLMEGVQKVFQGLTDISQILQVCRYETE
ncbi:MAG: Flp pilus assembly complex ATPase component TadA [Deltaproteobacteria bacterium]|nr:Flp pilus assembly complex ATPase component TadA [Deltaproteobacteria bacterium]